MGKQDGEESHASSSKSLIEFWDTGQPQFLLPCWIQVNPPAPTQNLKRVKKKWMVNAFFMKEERHTFTLTCWLTDGTQVQAHSPVDSAVISGIDIEVKMKNLGMKQVHVQCHVSMQVHLTLRCMMYIHVYTSLVPNPLYTFVAYCQWLSMRL